MDARVPVAAIVSAFGLAITVTGPNHGDAAVATTGVWIPDPAQDAQPVGQQLHRGQPRRVMAIPRDSSLSTIPNGSTVVAPEEDGQAAKTWRAEGYAAPVESDLMRVVLREG